MGQVSRSRASNISSQKFRLVSSTKPADRPNRKTLYKSNSNKDCQLLHIGQILLQIELRNKDTILLASPAKEAQVPFYINRSSVDLHRTVK